MATTEIMIPLVEADRSDIEAVIAAVAAAAWDWGTGSPGHPDDRLDEHPSYVLAEQDPVALLDALVAVRSSLAVGRYTGTNRYMAIRSAGLMRDELVARLDRRPDDAF